MGTLIFLYMLVKKAIEICLGVPHSTYEFGGYKENIWKNSDSCV